MEIGIREAKKNLSALVKAAQSGEEVILTRRGQRVAAIIAIPVTKDPKRGLGMWKGRLPENWEENFHREKKRTEADFFGNRQGG
jgi:prevent-host-death family protein